MPWWLPIVLMIGLSAVGELLRPKPKFEDARATSLGDFDSPTSDEGRAIPVVYGTCHIKGPNVLWYGDYAVSPIKEKVSTGSIFGGSKRVTVGYLYYLGLQYGLCMGEIDEFVEVRYDDKALPDGALYVTASTGDIVFRPDSGSGWYTASIPPGRYGNCSGLALAVETAIKAAHDGPWKVVYGMEVIPGLNDQIVYGVSVLGTISDRVATILPGRYGSGAEMAAAIARALNTAETAGGARGTFACIWLAGPGHFRITFSPSVPGYDFWRLTGEVSVLFSLSRTAWVNMGFDTNVASYLSSNVNTIESVFGVREDRFIFAYQGNTAELRLSDAAFTARVTLGFSTVSAADVTGMGVALADYVVQSTGTTYLDAGDFTRVLVNAPTLFGGEKAEGGIVGTLDVYHGSATQEASDYLEGVLGTTLPGYRGLCYAVARRMYIGTNLYIKPVSFVVRRTPNPLGLAGGSENIDGDANPACAVWDILTDTTWGIGLPASSLDLDSFVAAANTLASEGLGVSMMFDTQAEAQEWVAEILRHVDGVIFEDPATAKVKMRLARADYTTATLPLVDESVAEVVRYSRASWDDLRNAVRVSYVDRANDFMERVVKAQDLASIQARGGIETVEDIPFLGLSNADAATKVAARALKAISYPIATVSIRANRTVWGLRPGDVFRLTWPEFGITDLPMRVAKVEAGSLEQGTLNVEAVEDIFGAPWTAYTPPSAPDWTDPASLPPPLLDARAEEVPYALLDAESNMVMTAGVPTEPGITLGYDVYTDPDGADDYRLTERITAPTPSGLLSATALSGDSSIQVDDGYDLASISSITDADLIEGKNLAIIEDEIVAFQYWNKNSDGTWQMDGVVRGVMDTVPADHAAGARVWIITGGLGLARPEEYPLGATVSVKLAPFNRRGTLGLSESTELSVAVAGRSTKPYPPGAMTMNSASFPENISGDLVVGWRHRDRLADWSYADGGLTASPEPTVTYTVRIYGESGTLIRTVTGITGTSYTYPLATEIADSDLGRPNDSLRATIEAVRESDGAVSAYRLDDTVDAAGYGMLYGQYYGGQVG